MLKSLGGDVMLFYFAPTEDKPSHLALGVAGDFKRENETMSRNISLPIGGKKYFFFEPRDYDHNKECIATGDLPDEVKRRAPKIYRVTADY